MMLGTISAAIEAMLGIPQFLLNFNRKNTSGLAPVLIMMWLGGDLYKFSYYSSTGSPAPLIICALF